MIISIWRKVWKNVGQLKLLERKNSSDQTTLQYYKCISIWLKTKRYRLDLRYLTFLFCVYRSLEACRPTSPMRTQSMYRPTPKRKPPPKPCAANIYKVSHCLQYICHGINNVYNVFSYTPLCVPVIVHFIRIIS